MFFFNLMTSLELFPDNPIRSDFTTLTTFVIKRSYNKLTIESFAQFIRETLANACRR
jgi:hypothetical protein